MRRRASIALICFDREQVNRQIGRTLQQNQRAAQRFKVHLPEDSGPAGFRLEVEVNTSFDDWAALSEGAYLLRSNRLPSATPQSGLVFRHERQEWGDFTRRFPSIAAVLGLPT
jgi:hypothetical protein